MVTVRRWVLAHFVPGNGSVSSQPLDTFELVSRCRTFRYLLQPTARQRAALELLTRAQCELYNAALEERRGAWGWERRSVSFVDQSAEHTELRAVRPEVLTYGVTVCRGTLKRLDRAFGAFYRRCQRGEQPGYPRFKSSRRLAGASRRARSGSRDTARVPGVAAAVWTPRKFLSAERGR
jgi:transposase